CVKKISFGTLVPWYINYSRIAILEDRMKGTVGALTCGSAALEDDAFVAEFESCRFPNAQFRHADHIRLAWIYLRRYDYQAAEKRMRRSIREFACHLGADQKYHETITILWMRLVNAALQLTSKPSNFSEFASAHTWLLNKEAIFEFYSRDLILS